MKDDHFSCSRCGRELAPTPSTHHAFAWSDSARIRAQGWVGPHAGQAVGLECLTHEEAEFLLPTPRAARGTGRFARRPTFVAEWSLA
jgi:hypothetical protein